MKAKDMFEELGYKLVGSTQVLAMLGVKCENEIVYEHERYSYCLIFRVNTRTVQKGIKSNSRNEYVGFGTIDFEELKAINQQIKELGWDNE